jgi:hypothetical protein
MLRETIYRHRDMTGRRHAVKSGMSMGEKVVNPRVMAKKEIPQ